MVGCSEDVSGMSREAMTCLIHELRVHQIELKMQNEELRRIQGDLEKTRDRYTHLYDFAPVSYFTLNEKGFVEEANLTAASLLGLERATLIGSPLSRYIVREDQDVYYLHRKRLLETGEHQSFKLRVMKKDGRDVYVNLACEILTENDSDLKHIRIVASDITLQTELENRLRQAQKMEAIGTLAGGIAHQFNNALSVIMGNIDLLSEAFCADRDVNQIAAQMEGSVSRMANLTRQLLAYAKGGKYQAQVMPLSRLVRETIPLLEHNIKSSVYVETNLPNDIRSVQVDRTQMQMVLSAVLANASEAIKNEGRIFITARNETIDDDSIRKHSFLKPGRYSTLTIEDDGAGMDLETSNRIFEPFFSTRFPGRGLGMAAAYGAIKNHNGFITVASAVNEGTAVKIYLPSVDTASEKIEKPRDEPPKGTHTILLIEDETIVLEVNQALLEKLGYRTLVARTGKEALHIADSFDGNIDLALLDLMLPDMAAEEIYRRIMTARPGLKVVICSGYSIEGKAREIIDGGAQGFIQKPFSLQQLSEKLKGVLDDPA